MSIFAEEQAAGSPYRSDNCHTYSYNFAANEIWDNIDENGCRFSEFRGVFQQCTIMFQQRGCIFKFEVNFIHFRLQNGNALPESIGYYCDCLAAHAKD